mmetsp:Transcript_21920/g.46592  ORF Transcript_21920/g.46592 Transcript_21920/m.46592 type:complete len:202 (-) Transcript_21920:177-782(-)
MDQSHVANIVSIELAVQLHLDLVRFNFRCVAHSVPSHEDLVVAYYLDRWLCRGGWFKAERHLLAPCRVLAPTYLVLRRHLHPVDARGQPPYDQGGGGRRHSRGSHRLPLLDGWVVRVPVQLAPKLLLRMQLSVVSPLVDYRHLPLRHRPLPSWPHFVQDLLGSRDEFLGVAVHLGARGVLSRHGARQGCPLLSNEFFKLCL